MTTCPRTLERATVATVEAQETRLDLLQANIMSMQSEQNALRGMVQGVATQMLIRPPVVVQPQLTRAVGAGQQHQVHVVVEQCPGRRRTGVQSDRLEGVVDLGAHERDVYVRHRTDRALVRHLG